MCLIVSVLNVKGPCQIPEDLIKSSSLGPLIPDSPVRTLLAIYQTLESYMVQYT